MQLDPQVSLDPIDALHSLEHAEPVRVAHDEELELDLMVWHLRRFLQIQRRRVLSRFKPQRAVAVLAVFGQIHHVALAPLRWQALITRQKCNVIGEGELAF